MNQTSNVASSKLTGFDVLLSNSTSSLPADETGLDWFLLERTGLELVLLVKTGTDRVLSRLTEQEVTSSPLKRNKKHCDNGTVLQSNGENVRA